MKQIKLKHIFLLLAVTIIVTCQTSAPAKAEEVKGFATIVPPSSPTSKTITFKWDIDYAAQRLASGYTLAGFGIEYWNTSMEPNANYVSVAILQPNESTFTYTITGSLPLDQYIFSIYSIEKPSGPVQMGPYLGIWEFLRPADSGYKDNTQLIKAFQALKPTDLNGYFNQNGSLSTGWKGYTSGLDGYEIVLYKKNGKKADSKKISNPYSVTYTFNKANNSNIYYFMVRYYTTIDGKTVFSKWSNKKYFVPQPKFTSKSSDVKQHSIKAKWKKVTGASKYIIYAKKANSKKWIKVTTLDKKKSSYTIKTIKGKTITVDSSGYDVKIVTEAKIGKKKVKSASIFFTHCFTYRTYR